MRTRLAGLVALILVLAVSGCGGGGDAAAPTSSTATGTGELEQIATEEVTTSAGGTAFKDADAVHFRTARTVCGLFSVESFAKRLKVPAKPEAVARAYAASAYPPDRREAPFQGCLEGFRRQKR